MLLQCSVGGCSTHSRWEVHTKFYSGNLTGRVNLGDPDVDANMVAKFAGSIKDEEYLDQLSVLLASKDGLLHRVNQLHTD